MKKALFHHLCDSALTAALLLAGTALAGCRKAHPAPPLERLELTGRFFDNIRNKNHDVAVRQGKKLLALDPSAEYLATLISIQQSNDAILAAQKLIDAGKIDEALKVIREASQKYSENRTLAAMSPKVTQLRNAKKLLRAMAKAKNSSAMRGARIAARAGLSQNMTPELEKFFSAYELREQAVAMREKQETLAAERNARQAALQAKKEEEKRKAEEARFLQASSTRAAESERARQAAGEVPDMPEEK